MPTKLQRFLIILLLAGTAFSITHSFNWTMMGLTTFLLAYLTKGSRRSRRS